MNVDDPIYVAGHNGMVGRAICRHLFAQGYHNAFGHHRAELDLRDDAKVDAMFARDKPRYVFLAAALVGGIMANVRSPADFIESNLAIQLNVVRAAYRHGVERLVFLGSSCIYPRLAKQPITEDALLTGPLEPTNRAYAVAKIAGIELLEAYRAQHGFRSVSAMPTNLYGPHDNFESYTSHVIPGMMAKIHCAKMLGQDVVLWGTGTPKREFLHVDDCAEACVRLMLRPDIGGVVNVGTGHDLALCELAQSIAAVVGFTGSITWDDSRPDGTPRKVLDVSTMHATGWRPKTELRAGLAATYKWFLERQE